MSNDNNERNWTGTFKITFKGDDVFYMSEESLQDDLKEILDMDDIEIINVEQIGDIVNK